MSAKKSERTIYTEDYYRMEKLVHDERFLELVRWIFSVYIELGCPSIPPSGFRRYEEYLDWLNTLFKGLNKWDLAEQEGKLGEILDPSLYKRIAKLRFGCLTVAPGHFIEFLLEELNLDPANKKYKTFLEGYLFFGKKHLYESPFSLRWAKNKKTDEVEFMILIYPHTKREDIVSNWDKIVENQKLFKSYQGKSKAWETFERDLGVFKIYQKIKAAAPTKRTAKGKHPLDRAVWFEAHKTYPNITMSQIRKIIVRVGSLDKQHV